MECYEVFLSPKMKRASSKRSAIFAKFCLECFLSYFGFCLLRRFVSCQAKMLVKLYESLLLLPYILKKNMSWLGFVLGDSSEMKPMSRVELITLDAFAFVWEAHCLDSLQWNWIGCFHANQNTMAFAGIRSRLILWIRDDGMAQCLCRYEIRCCPKCSHNHKTIEYPTIISTYRRN